MPPHLEIAGRRVGSGQPTYIVAELSANHHQQFEMAEALVRAAKECGADAVKLQHYTPDTLTIRCESEPFRVGKGTLWAGKYLHDLYQEATTPWDWLPRLQPLADSLGLHLFSTPFDPTAVEYLAAANVPAYKIASFEIVDLPLVSDVARRGKPVILSTGMATWKEIDDAVAAIRAAGNPQLALLQCTSAYPAPACEMNLLNIARLAERYDVPVGLSDHTFGHTAAVAAVALGATIIEKHLTLDRNVPGPDAAFSSEPAEFAAMVEAVRAAEQMLAETDDHAGPAETASRQFRRSLFVVADIAAGEVFTSENVRSIRPAHGLPPKHLPQVLGRRAACALERGTPLAWEHIAS